MVVVYKEIGAIGLGFFLVLGREGGREGRGCSELMRVEIWNNRQVQELISPFEVSTCNMMARTTFTAGGGGSREWTHAADEGVEVFHLQRD